MDTLIANDALRAQYGAAARARVLEKFDLQKVMAQTEEVLFPEENA